MSTVFLSSETNSTLFTTCCEVAICDDQRVCPYCRREVLPFGRAERWEKAYGPIRRGGIYGNPSPNDGCDGRGERPSRIEERRAVYARECGVSR